MNADYYVLERDGNYQIVSVSPGFDPLYVMGSWNLYSGPHTSRDAAEKVIEWVTR